jgi:hypothetical protein
VIAPRDPFWVRIIVVDAHDVGGDVFPAVVANHGVGGVEDLGQVIQPLDVVPLCRQVGRPNEMNAPRVTA